MAEDDDEFEALYEGLDDESLAQVEVVATQQHQQSRTAPFSDDLRKPAHSIVGHQAGPTSPTKRARHHDVDASATTAFRRLPPSQLGRPSPGKRPRLNLVPGPASTFTASQDDYETPEVIWTENGYVTHASSQSRSRGPAPNDFEVRHNGPGRPPALGAGYGKALHDEEADDWAVTDPEAWDKAEEEAVRLSQRKVSPERATRQRHLGTLGAAARSAQGLESVKRPVGLSEQARTSTTAQKDRPDEVGDVAKLQSEIEAMKAQLSLALKESKDNKSRMYAREGEIKIVREKHDKVERELAEIRIQAQKQQEDFQRRLEERERLFAAEKERIDTQAAFHRLEHETSAKRTMWPGSARRRPAYGGIAASQSYSQAPYAPPPVMPTTPTRRNRGEPRTPGSQHRSGSQGRPLPSSTRLEQEESPSRRARGRREMPSGRPMAPPGPTPKRSAFPGFDNSFTADFSAPRKRAPPEDPPGGDDAMLVDDVEGAFAEAGPAVEESSAQQAVPPLTDQPTSFEEIRRQRHLWALSALSRRRAGLVALLLSHFSDSPLAPRSLPRSRYLSTPVLEPKLVPTHPSTFHRLLDVVLPPGTHQRFVQQHRAATELLLGTMTEGVGGGDGPRRLALWAKEPHERPPAVSARAELEEAAYWECQELIDESMQDLFEDLATGLRTLAGIYLRLCMMDALRDVFSLVYALSIAEPTMINYFTALELPYELLLPAPHAAQDDKQQTQPTQHDGKRGRPPLPTHLNACIIECVRKACRPLPLRVSSPESIPVEAQNSGPIAGTQSRWARNKATKDAEAAQNEPWDMGFDQRNGVLEGVLELLEVFVWYMGGQCTRSLREVFEAPGFIVTFLDAERPASIARRFIRLLIQLAQYPDFWKCLVACSLDPALKPGLPGLVMQSRTPLLELLSKQLVDLRSRASASSAHRLHCGIITLLTQLVIKHEDALVLVRESKSVFAALVQSIHTDTSAIWNDDRLSRSQLGRSRRGAGAHLSDDDAQEHDADRVEDVVERIVVDVRLLAQVYAAEERAEDLKQRLNSHEMHMLLNGIRHCFVLAFSRLAFAEEPAWMPEECVRELQSGVADRCSDLIEMVLSPDEVESVWEICAGDGDEDGKGEGEDEEDYDGEDEVMLEAHEHHNGPTAARRTHSAQEESQTQSEPSVNAR